MTTTAETAAAPLAGDIIVRTHDGASCVAWTLGTTAVRYGLTLSGIAAAARATGEFLEGFSAAGKRTIEGLPGITQVRISPHEWLVPLVPGRAADIEALMISVINAEGSIGQVP
jgi:hypothetical protein